MNKEIGSSKAFITLYNGDFSSMLSLFNQQIVEICWGIRQIIRIFG